MKTMLSDPDFFRKNMIKVGVENEILKSNISKFTESHPLSKMAGYQINPDHLAEKVKLNHKSIDGQFTPSNYKDIMNDPAISKFTSMFMPQKKQISQKKFPYSKSEEKDPENAYESD